MDKQTLLFTHVGFVLEMKVAPGSEAMKVSRPLLVVVASDRPAVFCRAKSLEALAHDGGVLPVVVGVHLNVRRTDVTLVATRLNREIRFFRILRNE